MSNKQSTVGLSFTPDKRTQSAITAVDTKLRAMNRKTLSERLGVAPAHLTKLLNYGRLSPTLEQALIHAEMIEPPRKQRRPERRRDVALTVDQAAIWDGYRKTLGLTTAELAQTITDWMLDDVADQNTGCY